MKVCFNVTCADTPDSSNQIVDLPGIGTAYSIGNPDPVDANPVDSLVQREQVVDIWTEAIFGRETDLKLLGLDELDNLKRTLGNREYVLAVGMRHMLRGRSNDDVARTFSEEALDFV